MMSSTPDGQDVGVGDDWHKSYSHNRNKQPSADPLSFDTVSDTPILDETITLVKDKVWSFRTALKGVAEALVHFGLSPSVVGYSSAREDDTTGERDEGEVALREVNEKEILSRAPFKQPSEERARQRRIDEQRGLVCNDEEYDDNNHAFVEAGRKEADEMKSLTGRWMGELADDDEQAPKSTT